MATIETIGNRMKELLEKKGLSQKDLAEMVGCTDAAISHYIKGDRMPRTNVLIKIAVSLDTTVDYLVEGTPTDVYDELVFAKKLIARNASQMSKTQKREIIDILMGDDDA